MWQAMLSVPHVFLQDSLSSEKSARRHYAVKEGDHLTLLNVYNAFEVVVAQDWLQTCLRP
jgi:hypothetical protein